MVLLGIAAFFILCDRPHQAIWLNDRQKIWLESTLQAERQQQKQIGHTIAWQLLKHRQIRLMVLIYASASSASTVLSVRLPQLPKLFHLDNLTTGLLNTILHDPASVLMIAQGRNSNQNDERRWHMALTLFMITAGVFTAFINLSLPAAVMILGTILIGAYVAEGLFWMLVSGWTSSTLAAAELAAIGAITNLIGGMMMINTYGIISERTGSHTLVMLPLAALCLVGGVVALTMGRCYSQTAGQEKQTIH